MVINIQFSKNNNPKTVHLSPGTFLFQLWGAEGGSWDSENYGGKGAYTDGIIKLEKRTVFYIYIGEKGTTHTGNVGSAPATFNGGGAGYLINTAGVLTHYGSSGGGATDVRTIKGESWDSSESLESRIMVAAGAGGATYNIVNDHKCKGGYGGSETGGDGVATGNGANIGKAIGGYQNNTGGIGGSGTACNGENGKLGIGGDGGKCYSTSGGGGGYYGGGGSGVSGGNHECGAGGSSYISGFHPTDIKDYKFFKIQMISGNEKIAEPNGTARIGHAGDGYARITQLNSLYCTNKNIYLSSRLFSYVSYI